MGKVSPEAPGTRAKGQHYTREGFGGLMREVGGGRALRGAVHQAGLCDCMHSVPRGCQTCLVVSSSLAGFG